MGRHKKQETPNIFYRAEKISVYQRPTIRGTKRLFLDIRMGGKRYYDFRILKGLELTGNAAHDADVRQMVVEIVARKSLEVVARRTGILAPHQAKVSFLEYAKAYIERSDDAEATQDSFRAMLKHLTTFVGKAGLTFGEIDIPFILRFQEHLIRHVAANSARLYLSKLHAVLSQAVTDGRIARNPMLDISTKQKPKQTKSKSSDLTLSELEQLAKTPCKKPDVARMFMFACLSGLRFSDVQALRWSNIKGNRVVFTQKKTKHEVETFLSESALEIVGTRPSGAKASDTVFPTIAKQLVWLAIKDWTKAAGLDKNISFHSARHTFAGLVLNSGVDLKVVSGLLGHSSIAMSERYAKVNGETKQAAINKQPKITLVKSKREIPQ